MINFNNHRRIAAWIALGWISLVAVVYYKRIWQLFLLGPAAWYADNPSLRYLVITLRVMLGSGLDGWEIVNVGAALARACTSIIGAVLVWIAAITLGTGLCGLLRCRFEHWIEKVVFHSAIGFGVFSHISLGMALFGIYRPSFVRVLVLGIAVIGMIIFVSRYRQREMGLRGRTILSELRHRNASIWHGIALLAAVVALIGSLAPEIEYDALWYHLWLPRLWLEQGTPVDLVSEYISLYPLTWELAFGAGIVTGGPIAAKLLNFICLLLTAGLIHRIVRRYTSQPSPWMAIAFWMTAPTVLWEATTAYVDLTLGFYGLLVIYSVLRYTEKEERRWVVMAGITAGFALGIKHLALILLVLVSAGLAIHLRLAGRRIREVVFPIMILAGLGLLIASPWYVRSWLASGNPVFPEMFSLFGAHPPERWDAITEQGLDQFKAHFGNTRTLPTLLSLPWDMTIHSTRYGGNLGPAFLMLVPVLLLFRNRTPVMAWLGGLVLLYLVFWASPLSSFQMRFLVPVVPLLAVLGAEGYGRINRAVRFATGKSGRRLLEFGIGALCLLNLPPFTSLHEFDRLGLEGWSTHVIHKVPVEVVLGAVTQEDYLHQMLPSYAAWQFIDSHLPEDSRILTFSGGDNFYSQSQRIPGDSTIARPAVRISRDEGERQFLHQLKLLGVTHILFEKKAMADMSTWNLAITQPEIISRWYGKVYEDNHFILYQVLQQ